MKPNIALSIFRRRRPLGVRPQSSNLSLGSDWLNPSSSTSWSRALSRSLPPSSSSASSTLSTSPSSSHSIYSSPFSSSSSAPSPPTSSSSRGTRSFSPPLSLSPSLAASSSSLSKSSSKSSPSSSSPSTSSPLKSPPLNSSPRISSVLSSLSSTLRSSRSFSSSPSTLPSHSSLQSISYVSLSSPSSSLSSPSSTLSSPFKGSAKPSSLLSWPSKARGCHRPYTTYQNGERRYGDETKYQPFYGGDVCQSVGSMIGKTPLIYLRNASKESGCHIFGKCEFLNPGGSVKDRPALFIIRDAERRGTLDPKKGGIIVEGSAGNTALGLAINGRSRNYTVICVIPDTQSPEKKDLLRQAGCKLVEVPSTKVYSPNHFVHLSGRLASELSAAWGGQFDNTANRVAHFETTGREIWHQLDGKIDAFVSSVGTGGTIAGVTSYLRLARARQLLSSSPSSMSSPSPMSSPSSPKEGLISLDSFSISPDANHFCESPIDFIPDSLTPSSYTPSSPSSSVLSSTNPPHHDLYHQRRLPSNAYEALFTPVPELQIVVADVPGAALYRYYTMGKIAAKGSSITENIGQGRITGNLQNFRPDVAYEIDDEETMYWCNRLMDEEGLPVGFSSGVNTAAAVRLGKQMGPNRTIVTVLCDYRNRYSNKMYNPAFLTELNLPIAESFIENKELDYQISDALKRAKKSDDEVELAMLNYRKVKGISNAGDANAKV